MGIKWQWVLIGLVCMAILLVAGWIGWKMIKEKRGQPELPEQLTTEFDPSENSGVFAIEAVDAKNKSLELRFVWPEKMKETRTSSTIECGEYDLTVSTQRGDSEPIKERMSVEKMFAKLTEVNLENTRFSGKCKDRTCREINRGCLLSIITN